MTVLTVNSEAVRRFHQEWQQAPSREDKARQEFAELLVEDAAVRLAVPSLPASLACDARVTPTMHAIWHMRSDLRAGYDLSTVDGYFGLIVWFVRHGWREYLVLRAQLQSLIAVLSAPWPSGAPDGRLSQFTCALWLSRPDLQEAFAITSPEGRDAFADWFLKKGVQELMPWPVLTPLQAEWLQTLETPKQDDPVAVPRFLIGVWSARPDLQAAIPAAEEHWGARLWEWYLTSGLIELAVTPEWVAQSAGKLNETGTKIAWV